MPAPTKGCAGISLSDLSEAYNAVWRFAEATLKLLAYQLDFESRPSSLNNAVTPRSRLRGREVDPSVKGL